MNTGVHVSFQIMVFSGYIGLTLLLTCLSHSLQPQKRYPVSQTLVSPIRVKTYRKKAARTAVGVEDVHPAIGPTSLVSDTGTLAMWPALHISRGGPQPCTIQRVQK